MIKAPYFVLCWVLDTIFDGRALARLWFLETVARVPYFSYISMLHLYESLGWWRIGASNKRVHFAEEWCAAQTLPVCAAGGQLMGSRARNHPSYAMCVRNEFHHLLIMESLGGDSRWIDRFMAGHASIIYYWCVMM